jgi:AraC family transcriptional activator of pobA
MTEMARAVRYRTGVPVYGYRTAPGVPPVAVLRMDATHHTGEPQRHIHDFPVLIYIERAGDLAVGSPPTPTHDGDAYVVAAGAVIDPARAEGLGAATAVYFDPAALAGDGQASWQAHPLLFPFLHGIRDGLLRLHVPPDRQSAWAAAFAGIERELADRAAGYRQAALAHLTLLLVDVARLATDVVGDLRRSNETMLAEVFDVIQGRFAEPLSLRDVAESVGVTPGYLTTVVRRRTGRTVVDWITEHRMIRARRLLAETDLPVGEIARRVGLPDAGYFTRVFRANNGLTPRDWRREAVS